MTFTLHPQPSDSDMHLYEAVTTAQHYCNQHTKDQCKMEITLLLYYKHFF